MRLPPSKKLCAACVATLPRRMALVAFALFAFFVRVGVKLAQVHLKPDASVVSLRDYSKDLKAYRGGIFDRQGLSHPLAQTVPSFLVFLDPGRIKPKDPRDVYIALARHSLCQPEKLYKAVTDDSGNRYKPLGETCDEAVLADIATNPVLRHCTGRNTISRRSYPLGRGLCHVVGVVNSEEEPLCGLEKTMNGRLRGTNGRIVGDADHSRREIRSRRREKIDPVDGCNVILSIDENLQFAVDQALDRAVDKWKPQAAWAVVQDPETGEILAMASRPDFDPDRFGESTANEQSNRAISSTYEPGSVMKTFAAAAAMDEGLVGTNSLLDVSNGLYCGRPLSDHLNWMPPGSTKITVADMLVHSSNRGATRLGMALGKERQQRHLKAFGFGRKTGLPLLGESAGRTIGDGSELNNARISMGQGMSVTAIQLIGAYSSIANGGRLMKPILVKEILDAAGNVVEKNEPTVVSRPVKPETAAKLRAVLKGVASRKGTAKKAAVRGYTVAGKTGTAQMVVDGRYSDVMHRGTFVGFFPADKPRFTILVTLEAVPPTPEDRRAYHGGNCAAPVFAEIAEAAARIFGVEPDAPDELP